jgi:pimeloyl-ACP methyl ester carboxylesterase
MASGNISPIRDLGFLAWQNDLSWMEGQHGPRWDAAVAFENKQFTDALKPLKHMVKDFTKNLSITVSEPDSYKGWSVQHSLFSPVQTWSYGSGSDKFSIDAWDADLSPGVKNKYIAAAVQNPEGYERFTLQIYKKSEPFKKIQQVPNVGPNVAFLDKTLVAYLGSEADHRYNSLRTIDVKSGEITILYQLPTDPTQNLELKRLEDGSACIIKSDFVTEELGIISDDYKTVTWVAKGACIIPITKDTWIKDNKTSLGLPTDEKLESISLKGEWAVTVANGIRTVWSIKDAKAKSQIFIWGEVSYDPREPTKLSISDMRYTPYEVNTLKWKLSPLRAYPFVCSYYNTKAPTFVVLNNNRGLITSGSYPRGLLVTAYSAYGMTTKVGTLVKRWLPLLKAGWAIASVALPGSGDADLAWRRAGQRENRLASIEIFIEAIKDLQEEFSLTPNQTALYGRSAGGLLVTAAVGQAPGLVGAIYIESPYVDILRTISNPFYSLTKLETKEFGIGSNPTDVIATGRWSPMERIPAGGYPHLFVVARTDKADLEVYPYEVLKYIRRVRGHSVGKRNKFVFISESKGHFTTDQKTRAEDLALLEDWLSEANKNLGDKYKMNGNGSMMPTMPTMPKMMGGKRNRKNRNNMTMKKNKNRSNKNRSNKNRKNKNRKNKNRTNKNRKNKD